MLVVRHDRNTVDLEALTRIQQHTAAGLFATAMSAFVQWLAQPGKLEKMRLEFRRLTDEMVNR